MRGGSRIFVILGIIILLGALAVGGVILVRRFVLPPASPTEIPGGGDVAPTEPVDRTDIVVGAQDTVPRGTEITSDSSGAFTMQSWPDDALPEGVITDVEDTYGRITRVDIVKGMPVLDNMLTDSAGEMGAQGSDAALMIPSDRVAYAMPVARYSSLAWALQPGDHVDVIVSLLMKDLDEEFHTALPNRATCLPPFNEDGCAIEFFGRVEVMPNGVPVTILPSQSQEARVVTQLTVQDAHVLQVGDWPQPEDEEDAAASPEGTPPPPSENDEAVPEGEGGEVQVEPAMPSIQPLTLAVSRQDAMVLEYAQIIGARVNFVLRPVQNTQRQTTEAVTLQYLMNQYNIEVPPKLPYGVTPSVQQLERIARYEEAAQYGNPTSLGGGAGAAE